MSKPTKVVRKKAGPGLKPKPKAKVAQVAVDTTPLPVDTMLVRRPVPTPAPSSVRRVGYQRAQGLPAILQFGYRVMTPKPDRDGGNSRVFYIIAAFMDLAEAKGYLAAKQATGRFDGAFIVPGRGLLGGGKG